MNSSAQKRPFAKVILTTYRAAATAFLLFIITFQPINLFSTESPNLDKFYHLATFIAWVVFTAVSLYSCEWLPIFKNCVRDEHPWAGMPISIKEQPHPQSFVEEIPIDVGLLCTLTYGTLAGLDAMIRMGRGEDPKADAVGIAIVIARACSMSSLYSIQRGPLPTIFSMEKYNIEPTKTRALVWLGVGLMCFIPGYVMPFVLWIIARVGTWMQVSTAQ
jgi:hypothetical protein